MRRIDGGPTEGFGGILKRALASGDESMSLGGLTERPGRAKSTTHGILS